MSAMPGVSVTISVPGLLTQFTDGQRVCGVQATTLGGCLDRLIEQYPHLEPHLFTGHGEPREHLLFIHNGDAVDLDGDADIPVESGDRIAILQSVSGG